jgi:hypothetical protein
MRRDDAAAAGTRVTIESAGDVHGAASALKAAGKLRRAGIIAETAGTSGDGDAAILSISGDAFVLRSGRERQQFSSLADVIAALERAR